MTPFRIEPLGKNHDRGPFSCGSEELDRYLKTQANQDARRAVATCQVVCESSSEIVVAYYTLSAASIRLHDLPENTAKQLPRYESIPAAIIGRLAVDSRFQRHGLGRAMLSDAVVKVVTSPIAIFALLVDAQDDNAAAYYKRFGFEGFRNQPKRMFQPVSSLRKSLLGAHPAKMV